MLHIQQTIATIQGELDEVEGLFVDPKEMPVLENMYFKGLPGEPARMSGLCVPNLDNGPYRFVRCDFHPRLRGWKEEAKNKGCIFA